MNRTIIALALAVATAAPALTAQTTQKLTASKINEYGLIYTLPRTAVDVTVEATKTVKEPGEFYLYAKKLLGLTPITEPSTTYRLESVSITDRATADESERYLVQFKSGSAPYMILSETNLPLAVNTEDVMTLPETSLPVARDPEPTILQTEAAIQAMTQEMVQSPSSAKRAELAAARIMELRQTRNDIIAGQADNMPSDGNAMQLALDNLARQEAALTAMFVGTTQTSTQVRTFTFIPGESDKRQVIARLSATEGIVDAGNLTGDPLYLDYRVTSRGKLPMNEKGETKRFPKGGFAYRIPGTASVSVSYDGNTIESATIDVAQLGVVFGLDPNIFTDKKAPATAIINPLTGAIVELGTR